MVLQLPWSVAADLAEEDTGPLAGDLRFESMAAVSASAAALYAKTVSYCCRQLIDSGAREISALVAQELIRLTASVMLTRQARCARGRRAGSSGPWRRNPGRRGCGGSSMLLAARAAKGTSRDWPRPSRIAASNGPVSPVRSRSVPAARIRLTVPSAVESAVARSARAASGTGPATAARAARSARAFGVSPHIVTNLSYLAGL